MPTSTSVGSAFPQSFLTALDTATRKKARMLDSYVFPKKNLSSEVRTELVRYFGLLLITDKELPMSSVVVDKAWHDFILYTREYAAFCEKIFGKFIHHDPADAKKQRSESSEKAVTAFQKLYKECYGSDPPDIWDPTRKRARRSPAAKNQRSWLTCGAGA